MNEILEKIKRYSAEPKDAIKLKPKEKKYDSIDITERFEFEIKRAGGNFLRAKSEGDIINHINDIIKNHNAKSIAFKNTIPENIKNSLRNDGLKCSEIGKILEEQNPKDSLSKYEIALSEADFLIAETGSIILKSKKEEGRMLSILTPVNIIIAKKSDILWELGDFLEKENSEHEQFRDTSAYIVITGPSRTADIEKILIIGVHGPKDLYLILQDF
jgi:L-lactate dehydrogenase complex protein LldG